MNNEEFYLNTIYKIIDDSTKSELIKSLDETASRYEPLGYTKNEIIGVFNNLQWAASKLLYEERCRMFSAGFAAEVSDVPGKNLKIILKIHQYDNNKVEGFILSSDI